jgi:hypothetical protein
VLLANGFATVRLITDAALGLRALVATAASPAASPRAPYITPDNVADVLWAPALTPLSAAVAGAGAGGAGPRDGALAVLQWRAAYGALCADAEELGIPRSVIPKLPQDDAEITLALVQERQAYLQGMVASFLSSGL